MECMMDSWMRKMAQKAIAEGKVFEYYLFWSSETGGWQEKAKRMLREELRK